MKRLRRTIRNSTRAAQLDALQAEVDALKRLQADTAAELDALLDGAFKENYEIGK